MPDRPAQFFLLSPASCSGQRAQLLFNEQAKFDLAQRVRTPDGASLGEVFSFLSGLYFRGKLTYARRFARAKSEGMPGIYVITAGRGLLSPDTRIGIEDLREFAGVPIDLAEPRYREPLEFNAQQLASQLPDDGRAILLGSIATDKYVEVLGNAFGERLFFPKDFAGRGDMSRGGLMLRAADANCELEYVSLVGAVRRGVRPAKLPKRIETKG